MLARNGGRRLGKIQPRERRVFRVSLDRVAERSVAEKHGLAQSRTTLTERMLRVTNVDLSVVATRGGTPGTAPGSVNRRMPVHIKLRSSKGERFERIKRQLSEEMGYEPTNPEVLGIIMAHYDLEESSRGSLTPLGRSG